MRLEHLRVIEDEPTFTPGDPNDLIVDALSSLPKEKQAEIFNDYASVNFYAPIYVNTKENLDRLISEGKKCTPSFNKDFAFLTCNRYGGIESFDDLSEKADYKNDIVPFVCDAIDKYQDVFVVDEISMDWLNKHLPRTGLISRKAFIDKVRDIIRFVDYENKALAKKLSDGPLDKLVHQKKDTYSLKEAIKEIQDLFQDYYEGTGKKKRGAPLKGEELKKAQELIYNSYKREYPDTREYSDLPYSVRQKYVDFFYENAVKKLDKILKSRDGSENEDIERSTDWEDIMADYGDQLDAIAENPRVSYLYNKYVPEMKRLYLAGEKSDPTIRAMIKSLINYAKKISKDIGLSDTAKRKLKEFGTDFSEDAIRAEEDFIVEKSGEFKDNDELRRFIRQINSALVNFIDKLNKSVTYIANELYKVKDENEVPKDKNEKYNKTKNEIKAAFSKFLRGLLSEGKFNEFANKINNESLKIDLPFFRKNVEKGTLNIEQGVQSSEAKQEPKQEAKQEQKPSKAPAPKAQEKKKEQPSKEEEAKKKEEFEKYMQGF